MADYLFCHYVKPQFEHPQVYDMGCGVHRIAMWNDGDVMVLAIDRSSEMTYWHVDTYYPPEFIGMSVRDEIWGRLDIDGNTEFILLSWNNDAEIVNIYDGVEK